MPDGLSSPGLSRCHAAGQFSPLREIYSNSKIEIVAPGADLLVVSKDCNSPQIFKFGSGLSHMSERFSEQLPRG